MTHSRTSNQFCSSCSRNLFLSFWKSRLNKKRDFYGFWKFQMPKKKDYRTQLFAGKNFMVIPLKWKKKYAEVLNKEIVDFAWNVRESPIFRKFCSQIVICPRPSSSKGQSIAFLEPLVSFFFLQNLYLKRVTRKKPKMKFKICSRTISKRYFPNWIMFQWNGKLSHYQSTIILVCKC